MPDLEREAQDLAVADEHIAEGNRRLSDQIRLAEGFPAGSRERVAADDLLAGLRSSLDQWHQHRLQILHLLDPARHPLQVRRVFPAAAASRDDVQRRLLPDASRWRLKAEELREAASRTENFIAGRTFLRLSRDYELLAERTERRNERERKLRDHGMSQTR
jgi:hypothetical protein